MANREVYPASLFPLRGDLSAEAGATTVQVVGVNGIPFQGKPTTLINGKGVSLDFVQLINTAFVINYLSDNFLGDFINGVQV